MSTTMFVVGFVIFSAYVYFLIWNIYYSNRKQREEGNGTRYDVDVMDMDGMGNFSRFPTSVPEKRTRPSKTRTRKTKMKDPV